MSRFDHSKVNSRDRMRQQGTDNVSAFGLPAGMKPPKPRLSKTAMRAEAAGAIAKITRRIACRCGHSGSAVVPPARAKAGLKCSKCGEFA